MDVFYHNPVMLDECIEALNIKPSGVYVDVTFGGGGHSRAILKQLDSDGRLFVFDQDADAMVNVPDDPRIHFFRSNFRYFAQFLRLAGCPKVDGVLADLGVSSHHFDDAHRGFSFRFDVPLDMRMNQAAVFSACELVNTYSAEQLSKVFREYGEIKNAWRLAQDIVAYRTQNPIVTVADLMKAAEKCIPRFNDNKYLATVFQAIRIEVNDEISVLQEFLASTPHALKAGGRLVVMTYHSLEDRPTKNYIKAGNFEGNERKDPYGNVIAPFMIVNRKVITPSDEELEQNPRSRSAKLRIGERTIYNYD
ncbi:MAG: 16S rRNA (cytosine(1402)-N(4))-methyltransferase RsmH [Bacteroidales bacterium]|nr:16S rRNA (cytosine(1402)-N(4))-methyltransferase RsmH [Bacteroidales bacterium]